jgi:hypothetical protein
MTSKASIHRPLSVAATLLLLLGWLFVPPTWAASPISCEECGLEVAPADIVQVRNMTFGSGEVTSSRLLCKECAGIDLPASAEPAGDDGAPTGDEAETEAETEAEAMPLCATCRQRPAAREHDQCEICAETVTVHTCPVCQKKPAAPLRDLCPECEQAAQSQD